MCGDIWHTKKYHKPHKGFKYLRQESRKTRVKRVRTAAMWLGLNPPDNYGYWECYLQISTMCPKKLNRQNLSQEHVYSKVRHPELKYVVENIKPACAFCNKMKGSRDITELAKAFHHIAIMIQRPEWKEWEAKLKEATR